ncbi:MAG: PrsW family glutamic-type intramembrane protease [Patescibacteria group bacterium]
MEILRIIISIALVFLPIVFWGYLFSYAQNSKLSATRFFIGIFAGSLSVLPIVHSKEIFEFFSAQSIFSYLSAPSISLSFIESLLVSYGLPIILFLGVLCAVFYKQIVGRFGLMMRSVGVIGLFVLAFLGMSFLLGGKSAVGDTQIELLGATLASLGSITLAYLFIGALEEATKHFALYPSLETAEITPKYIALTAVFTALGFAFLENVYYLIHLALENGMFSSSFLGTLISRSIVSLLLHIFAALVFALGFGRYIAAQNRSMYGKFILAFFLAIGVHALFDISLTYGKTGIIAIYAIVGYFFFTKVFFDERAQS